ncbi:MAG TPA: hypothetical protein VNU68_34905 [Verrucomicrobiae bacterium]|nr:hypothetical protein [Verrucomicrobiae bacterium]
MIEAGKRYHVVNLGEGFVRLVEGIPDPEKPDDPSKDRKDGDTVIAGENYPGSPFWAEVLAADVVWTDRGYKRFWEYAPLRAARIREGAL